MSVTRAEAIGYTLDRNDGETCDFMARPIEWRLTGRTVAWVPSLGKVVLIARPGDPTPREQLEADIADGGCLADAEWEVVTRTQWVAERVNTRAKAH